MIIENRYPTQITIPSGDGIVEHNTELTDLLTNLTANEENYSAYWLYWIGWGQQTIPSSFKSFRFETADTTLSAISTTTEQNIAASFLSRNAGQNPVSTSAYYYISDYRIDSNNHFVENTNTGIQARFYNNYSILKTAASFAIPSSHMPFVVFVSGPGIQTGYAAEPSSSGITAEDFYNFIIDNYEISFTLTGWYNLGVQPPAFFSDPITIAIRASQFNENGIAEIPVPEHEEYTFTIIIGDYAITPGRDINVNGELTNYTSPVPCLWVKEDGSNHFRCAAGGSLIKTAQHAYDNHITYNFQTNTILQLSSLYPTGDYSGINSYHYAGGLEFEIERQTLHEMPAYSLLQTGNVLIYKYSPATYQYFIYHPYTIEEIHTHMNLYNRWMIDDTSTTRTFEFSDNYSVPQITEDDMFYRNATSIGDYETIKGLLRPWQDGYFINNDFNTDDIPEYDPYGPGGGPDEDEGSITLNTPGSLGMMGGFTTSYVLNSTQVQRIGEALWSTIQNTDRLTAQNFFSLIFGNSETHTDYSLTLSEIISYFISLKFFPFNLDGVSQTAEENGIRVGTGVSAISTGTRPPKKLTEPYITLNGGTVKIPGKWNNYLDVEPNTTCSVYIPYCGTTTIPLSIVSGSTLELKYCVDLITGGMTAVIMKSGTQSYPIATVNGSCGFDMMMTGTNGNAQATNAMTNLASKTVSWTGDIIKAGVNGAMSYATGSDASGVGALNGMIGSVGGVLGGMLQDNISQPSLLATAPLTMGASTTLSGLILPQIAYVQIRRHNPYRSNQSLKYDDISPLAGYRSYFSATIREVDGYKYIKCQNVDLSPVAEAGATEKEIEIIRSKLLAGIFLY